MIPESVDVRHVLCKEGIKLEMENQFIQMQEQIADLKEKHCDEQDNIANSYMSECEKNYILQTKLDEMELELNSVRDQLNKKTKEEEILIKNTTDVQIENDKLKNENKELKKRCLKRKKTIASYKEQVETLKSEVAQLNHEKESIQSEKESMQSTIERMQSVYGESEAKKRWLPKMNGDLENDFQSSFERIITPDIMKKRTLPLIGERKNIIADSSSLFRPTSSLKVFHPVDMMPCPTPKELRTNSLKSLQSTDALIIPPTPPRETPTKLRRRRSSSQHRKIDGIPKNQSNESIIALNF